MKSIKNLLSVSVVAIAACGGGGNEKIDANGVAGVFGPATLAGTFSYYRDASTNNPVSYLYAQDFDGDGIDEVLMVAFETQPNTPNEYSDTNVRVFGWKNGVFQNLTTKWLPNGQDQVGGVGDVDCLKM
jgi:hypothetical protein